MIVRATKWAFAVTVALAAVTPPLYAQAGKTAASAPEPAHDPKDLTGYWVSVEGPFTNAASFNRAVRLMRPDLKEFPVVTDLNDYPNHHPTLPIRYTPEFEAIHKKMKAEYDAGQPYRTGYMCQPNGLLFAIIGNMPFEILSAPGRLLFTRQAVGTNWHVYFDRPLKTEFDNPELFGDSVGRWEGDTLVVESVNLGGHAMVVETEPFSQSMRLVQRIRRPTHDRLIVDIVATDKRAWLDPLRFHTEFRLDNKREFAEGQCWGDGGGKPMAFAAE